MTQWMVILVACATVGCRRHHAAPDYGDSPTAPSAPAAPVEAPPTVVAPASGPSTGGAAPSLPDGGTINGDPRGPRAAAFNALVNAALPRLQACFDGVVELPPGEHRLTIHYVVEPPGYTGAVAVNGDAEPATVVACCRRVVAELRFPPFRGPKVEQELPVTYQKTSGQLVDQGAR